MSETSDPQRKSVVADRFNSTSAPKVSGAVVTGPDSEGLQAEAVERVKVARKALTERHVTALAAASPIRWWDEKLLREFLIQAACPIVCVGHRQPGGTDWHEWCERKADAAMAALAGVLPPQSPVVPSVGAVPVEVPEEAVDAAAKVAVPVATPQPDGPYRPRGRRSAAGVV